MVRFSLASFWPSLLTSITCSVGTTTWRTSRPWPIVSTRCSRLCLTLFSCPEYVLITYQRNIQDLFRVGSSQDQIHELAEDQVERPQVCGGDHDEDQGYDRGLDQRVPNRPLNLLPVSYTHLTLPTIL